MYANWFNDVYFRPPWDTWFVGAAQDVSGILPSQNALESFHRTIKAAAVSTLRARTAVVLNDFLPSILRLAGMDSEKTQGDSSVVAHYADGNPDSVYSVIFLCSVLLTKLFLHSKAQPAPSTSSTLKFFFLTRKTTCVCAASRTRERLAQSFSTRLNFSTFPADRTAAWPSLQRVRSATRR